MHTFILQDYTTIRGAGATVTQGEAGWIDLSSYQDVVFWVDVREITGTTVTLTLQTSPTKDDAMFLPLVSPTAITTSPNPSVLKALMTSASTPNPVARYVRWSLYGSASPWDATFRILAAANSPGM